MFFIFRFVSGLFDTEILGCDAFCDVHVQQDEKELGILVLGFDCEND